MESRILFLMLKQTMNVTQDLLPSFLKPHFAQSIVCSPNYFSGILEYQSVLCIATSSAWISLTQVSAELTHSRLEGTWSSIFSSRPLYFEQQTDSQSHLPRFIFSHSTYHSQHLMPSVYPLSVYTSWSISSTQEDVSSGCLTTTAPASRTKPSTELLLNTY